MADFLVVVVDYCDKHPSARATYIAVKDDGDIVLCDHCTHHHAPALVDQGFHLELIPGVRQAATVVTPGG